MRAACPQTADRLLRTASAEEHFVEQELKLRRYRRIDQRLVSVFQYIEQHEATLCRHDMRPACRQQILSLEALDDLGPRGRRTNPLRLLQPLAVLGVLDVAPRVRHGLDQCSLVVPGRRLCLLRVHPGLAQVDPRPVPQWWQHLARFLVPAITAVALGFLAECCPPANLNRLSAYRAERVAVDVKQRGRLAVAKIWHQRGQVGAGDDHEQSALIA
jgi:hypothetical protein